MRATDLVQRAEKTCARGRPLQILGRSSAPNVEAGGSHRTTPNCPRRTPEFLYETCAESRRDFSYGDGVTLSTSTPAKGTEHDHVPVIGHGCRSPTGRSRRTAARLLRRHDPRTPAPSSVRSLRWPSVTPDSLTARPVPGPQRCPASARVAPPAMDERTRAELEKLQSGLRGCFETHPIHAALVRT